MWKNGSINNTQTRFHLQMKIKGNRQLSTYVCHADKNIALSTQLTIIYLKPSLSIVCILIVFVFCKMNCMKKVI